MNKIIYFLLLTPALFLACKKDGGDGPGDRQKEKPAYDVNLYGSTGIGDEFDMPQITVKDERLQITALGRNYNGVPQELNKLYLSDSESETEWIIVLGDDRKPAFMYEINSATGAQEPYLYWYERAGGGVSYIRYYEYDWTNRLGVLQYEVKLTNGEREILFDGEREASLPVSLSATRGGAGPQGTVGKLGKKHTNTAFAAPVTAFDQIINDRHRHLVAASNDHEDLNEWLDGALEDFLRSVKDSYDEILDNACAINIFSRVRGAGCGITEAVKEFTDRHTVDELDDARREQQQQPDPQQRQTYDGSGIRLDIGIFPDLSNITNAIEEHLNRFGDRWTDRYDRLSDWIESLMESASPDGADLDDLPNSAGVLQIGLSWNSTSDIDLHVTDPSGTTIYYGNPESPSGGYLDRDDVDGYGPENIYWRDNIPDGTYTVRVHYYASNETNVPVSRYVVKVSNGLGRPTEFISSLTREDEMSTACRFTKNGREITFH